MSGLRVLVTGGRKYRERARVFAVLNVLEIERGPIDLLIAGCAGGVDHTAHDWADKCGVEHVTWHAGWRRKGIAAGPIRNLRMLELRPDLVIAFPGGAGTADMVKAAKRAGVEVVEVKP